MTFRYAAYCKGELSKNITTGLNGTTLIPIVIHKPVITKIYILFMISSNLNLLALHLYTAITYSELNGTTLLC